MTAGGTAGRPASGRALLGVAVFVLLAVLAAGCGSHSPGSHVAEVGSTTTSSVEAATSAHQRDSVAFSRCMRSHGVVRFPDPGSNGMIPKVSLEQLGISSSKFLAAQRGCQRLSPSSGQSRQAWDQQVMTALLRFARCVRSHGVTNWPDPLAESDPGQPGTPGFPRSMPGVNQDAPQVEDATSSCQHLLAAIGYGAGGYP